MVPHLAGSHPARTVLLLEECLLILMDLHRPLAATRMVHPQAATRIHRGIPISKEAILLKLIQVQIRIHPSKGRILLGRLWCIRYVCDLLTFDMHFF